MDRLTPRGSGLIEDGSPREWAPCDQRTDCSTIGIGLRIHPIDCGLAQRLTGGGVGGVTDDDSIPKRVTDGDVCSEIGMKDGEIRVSDVVDENDLDSIDRESLLRLIVDYCRCLRCSLLLLQLTAAADTTV